MDSQKSNLYVIFHIHHPHIITIAGTSGAWLNHKGSLTIRSTHVDNPLYTARPFHLNGPGRRWLRGQAMRVQPREKTLGDTLIAAVNRAERKAVIPLVIARNEEWSFYECKSRQAKASDRFAADFSCVLSQVEHAKNRSIPYSVTLETIAKLHAMWLHCIGYDDVAATTALKAVWRSGFWDAACETEITPTSLLRLDAALPDSERDMLSVTLGITPDPTRTLEDALLETSPPALR